MIPKYQVPEITEFINAYVVEKYTHQATSMKVFVPSLMLDKTASKTQYTTPINSSIFNTKETIRTSTSIKCNNYITVGVSPTIALLPHNYAVGEQVRLYCPNLNLEKAVVVPF